MSCIRDSLTIFWTLTSFGNCISWAPSFVTHVICLTDPGWLHSRAAALQWLYHRPRISARINNLSWVVFMDPNTATWCQSSPSLWSLQSWVFTVVGAVLSFHQQPLKVPISAALHDPSISCRFHTVKTSTSWETLRFSGQHDTLTWPTLNRSLHVLTLRKHFQKILPQWCLSLNHNVPAKRRFHFCDSVSC